MIKDITLRRLQDVKVKGNFSINCENHEQFMQIQSFFETSNDWIWFRNIEHIGRRVEDRLKQFIYAPYVPLFITPDNRIKFTIKYESLNELLKLREIFNIRASKFDMYLIKKRDYNPFSSDFYSRCADKTIYKIKK